MSDALKVLDLFSGIGGFSLGLERTGGFKTVAFCEIDKAAQNVLKKHWPTVPIFEDIKKLKGEDVGTIDVITGGFPCQDISLAGKGAGLEGARSGLWWEYHRLIKETKPKWIIAENVSALRSRGLDQVLRSLAEIGYDAEWHCIPASAVGAPHRRDRIWIVAYSTQLQRNGGNDNSRIGLESKEESELGDRGWQENVAYTSITGLEGLRTRTICSEKEHPLSSSGSCVVRSVHKAEFWAIEPNVGRVVNGVSGRVDRLKQLGNAVVPQIPELIGKALLQREYFE